MTTHYLSYDLLPDDAACLIAVLLVDRCVAQGSVPGPCTGQTQPHTVPAPIRCSGDCASACREWPVTRCDPVADATMFTAYQSPAPALLQLPELMFNSQVTFSKIDAEPVMLQMPERRLLRLVEAALSVSEYTDKVDVLSWNSKTGRIHAQIKDICAILCGLVVAQDYKKGQKLMQVGCLIPGAAVADCTMCLPCSPHQQLRVLRLLAAVAECARQPLPSFITGLPVTLHHTASSPPKGTCPPLVKALPSSRVSADCLCMHAD